MAFQRSELEMSMGNSPSGSASPSSSLWGRNFPHSHLRPRQMSRGRFSPHPRPRAGSNPRGVPRIALVHISLCDVNYSHIHELLSMVYKQIPSIKIHI